MLLCVQHTAKKTSVQNFLSGVFFVAGNLLSAITPRSAAPLRSAASLWGSRCDGKFALG